MQSTQSARQETEARLREAEAKFRTLVEHGTAIVYIDQAELPSDTIYVSPQVEDVFGWPPEAFLEDQDLWMNSIHPDDRERVEEQERKDESGTFSADYRIVNRAGETVWLHEQGNLIRESDGTSMYWLGIALDVSESKRAELLERELALEQATSAKLKSLDQAKDDLLATVSHDFRSPLSNIIGFGLTLQRSLPTLGEGEALDYVGRIVQNAWRLERLVSDVLDVSRLREGLLELERQEVDLGKLAREITSQISVGKEFTLSAEAESVVVLADSHMLERAIENLVTNAVRHNTAGANIRVQVREMPGGAQLSVVDDGVGVPAELEASLFEPFTSGQNPRQDPSPGLGLGLAIVQQVTALHGGQVWHEETPGGGATFRVFLPANTDATKWPPIAAELPGG